MNQNIHIIGVSLIKNEDLYIERVLRNVLDFCDEIIVLDNMSEDDTYRIVEKLSQDCPKIKLQRIADYKKSHIYLYPYIGTKTWVFRVDGDEIYDPIGLQKLRKDVLAGKYQRHWRLEGNSLNCTEINFQDQTAMGYLSPPSKPAPMLYNFSLLQSWKDDHAERLHGKNIMFKDGFSKNDRLLIFEKFSWEESFFRCLHICFLKRSHLDKKNVRLNPNEMLFVFPKMLVFLRNLLRGRLSLESSYKLEKYKRGKLISKNIGNFFV